MKKIVLAFAVAGVVAAFPAASGAATVRGVVVGKERSAVLVASPAGVVRSVAGRAAVGSRIVMAGGRLHVVGRAHTTRLRGVVVSRSASTLFLSSNHHLLAVHIVRGAVASEKPGDVVATQVSIAQGQLDDDETDTDDVGQTSTVQVQALVTAVAPGSLTVTVNGQPLTIHLPGNLTLPASLVGHTVTIQLKLDDEQANDDANDNANDDDDAAGSAPTATGVTAGNSGDDHGDDGGGDNGGHGDGGGDDGGGHH